MLGTIEKFHLSTRGHSLLRIYFTNILQFYTIKNYKSEASVSYVLTCDFQDLKTITSSQQQPYFAQHQNCIHRIILSSVKSEICLKLKIFYPKLILLPKNPKMY